MHGQVVELYGTGVYDGDTVFKGAGNRGSDLVVENLPLAEMTRLADSLVGLASLRQLITGKASVGGPVDLVRITKVGGLEWVRRKDG